MSKPRPPIALEDVFESPSRIEELLECGGPYWPTMRYVATGAELQAVGGAYGGSRSAGTIPVAPWFRADWVDGDTLLPGAEAIRDHAGLAEAARALFGAEFVRPRHVYVNLMTPIRQAGQPHVDVPQFRGMDRSRAPVWLLHCMARSGLFERWRVRIATAVVWFYEGPGGEFDYWPEGPAGLPRRAPAATNTALMGDNDSMFHRVGPVGEPESVFPGELSLEAELCAAAPGRWEIRERGKSLAEYGRRQVRASVSWKAEVLADAAECALLDEHRDDLDPGEVAARFAADVSARGLEPVRPSDPLSDPRFVAQLNQVYPPVPPEA
ncbi:MAG: hypothetical protein J4G09_03530 [Proteobacteria bacterium]|nr:hypothetical protein [Pseudomonadota bacterium]